MRCVAPKLLGLIIERLVQRSRQFGLSAADRAAPPDTRRTFSLLRQFRTRCFGTPPLRAISTPQCVRSISRVECASGLMLIMQPRLSAVSCQRQSRSSRHGFALISTATPCSAQAARTFSISMSYPGRRRSWRPVICPRMVVPPPSSAMNSRLFTRSPRRRARAMLAALQGRAPSRFLG